MANELTLESGDLNITLESCTFNRSRSDAAILTLVSIMGGIHAMLNACTFTYSNITIFYTNNAIMEDCTLRRSPLVITDAEYVILEDCTVEDTYPRQILITGSSTVILSKLRIFGQEDNWELSDDTNIVLKDCQVQTTTISITRCNTTIAGESVFTSSAIQAQFSSITMSGNISIENYHNFNGAMFLDLSNLTITAGAEVTFFNNSASNSGGALLIMLSNFYMKAGANVKFINNSANDKGGAIYVKPGVGSFVSEISIDINSKCLFQLSGETHVLFANNSAINGAGDDVYGATLENCQFHGTGSLTIDRSGPPSLSSISSDPQRVCLCDTHGVPQCNAVHNTKRVHPGESFIVSAVIVGWDYPNTTTGVIHTGILHTGSSIIPELDSNSQRGHVISSSKQCANLTFTLYSKPSPENVTMYITTSYMDTRTAEKFIQRECNYPQNKDKAYCKYKDHLTPVFFNITFLECPAGFKLLPYNQSCDCYLHNVLFDSCDIKNGTGYFLWTKTLWVSIEKNGLLLYSTHCPFDYCNATGKGIDINLQDDSDSQCAFNRAGRLCGGCKANYSLAIGSSHCIHCPNNNNLALLIFFTAAGFLLVFFISALNLTVTQGMINGPIFYANIVWSYQRIFFPQELIPNPVLRFLMTFIAWINLDFGIETCFVDGLNALWKAGLQFVFPFYIWIIAGLIIMAAKYSTRLTNFLGNRGVPVLGTLFLLSYIKLLRISFSIMEFCTVTWEDNSTLFVWSMDGNISYTDLRHILLLMAGFATLLFFLLPYTILLFLIQCFRKISHFWLLKWIVKFHPVFDAYIAPLKHKHHYWFGILLLARVLLSTILITTLDISQSVNILILFTVGTTLLLYMILVRPYKNTAVLVLQSSSLANLVFLSGWISFTYHTDVNNTSKPWIKTATIMVSIGVAVLQFCGIVLYLILAPILGSPAMKRCCPYIIKKVEIQPDNDCDIDPIADRDAGYRDFDYNTYHRDPVLNESQPLLPTY
jgi:predicted outer membrane repeat protein